MLVAKFPYKHGDKYYHGQMRFSGRHIPGPLAVMKSIETAYPTARGPIHITYNGCEAHALSDEHWGFAKSE